MAHVEPLIDVQSCAVPVDAFHCGSGRRAFHFRTRLRYLGDTDSGTWATVTPVPVLHVPG